MATKGAIELIPKEVTAVKERAKISHRFLVFSIVFFVLSLATSSALLFYKQDRTSHLESVEEETALQGAGIAQFADIEKKVLGLGAKSSAIPQILSQRDYFSVVLSSVKNSRPSGVVVTGLAMSEDETEVTINGETFNYSELANFLDNLVGSGKGGVLFTQVSLTSVNLKASSGKVSFIIDAIMKKDGLKKPLPGTEEK